MFHKLSKLADTQSIASLFYCLIELELQLVVTHCCSSSSMSDVTAGRAVAVQGLHPFRASGDDSVEQLAGQAGGGRDSSRKDPQTCRKSLARLRTKQVRVFGLQLAKRESRPTARPANRLASAPPKATCCSCCCLFGWPGRECKLQASNLASVQSPCR